MYIPLYIPKSLIVGFLLVVGCAAGWLLPRVGERRGAAGGRWTVAQRSPRLR